jgi:hypothetical protein
MGLQYLVPHKERHATGGSDALTPADIGAASNFHEHLRRDITDLPESFQNRAPLYSRIVISGASPSFLNGPLDLLGLSSVTDYSRPNYEGIRSSGERVQIIYEDDVFQIRSIFNGATTWHASSVEVERWSPLGLNWKVWDTPSPVSFPVTISGEFAFFVSKPTISETSNFLKGDGTWADVGALGLSASSYVIAKPGDNLITKYAEAKALTPNGAAKSATNRATLMIMPGRYSLSGQLTLDAEFVDVIGLGAQTKKPTVFLVTNGLDISADDVCVSGISGGLTIIGNKPSQIFVNCQGLGRSFGSFLGDGTIVGYANGTFIGCTASLFAFGCGSSANGTFINCTAEDFGFGGIGVAGGKFIDCSGGDYSFGGFQSGIASGTFINCTGLYCSFGGEGGTASGTFINCTGGARNSFGVGVPFGGFGNALTFPGTTGIASGTFVNCRAPSFPALTAPQTGRALMVNCLDDNGNIIEGQAPV